MTGIFYRCRYDYEHEAGIQREVEIKMNEEKIAFIMSMPIEESPIEVLELDRKQLVSWLHRS